MDKRKGIKYRYDVFLSYNSNDRTVIECFAFKLKEAGIAPFFDRWHLVPGEPWQEELEIALENSATCAVFLGPNGLGPWENEEMRTALDKRVHNKFFRVIPVILPGDETKQPLTIPLFLSRLTYVDYRAGLNDDRAFRRLLSGIRGKQPEEVGPDISKRSEIPVLTWLTIKLERGNSEERSQAARELGELKNKAAISILESRWLQEPDATVRYWLAIALGEIGDEKAIEVLHRVRTKELNQFALSGIDEALEGSTE